MAHYTPWLTHWWTSQNGFPVDCAMSGGAKYSRQDLEIMPKLAGNLQHLKGQHEAFFRDMMIGFSGWGMDPMDLKNPFRYSEGSVHLWQGDEDGLVPVTLQRYIAERLPWIHYYEIAGAGHVFPYADGMGEAILRALLLGEK
ncbi:unnamed protein product [Ilex paraguariensis]|uniref:Uncharacterized protein n=1 Tax=Ilex paraguariensis TaxID=185542 RepID=A0ABC8UHX7_9AQUA